MRQGTIVDATIIAAPPSTKNRSKRRAPEMHQTKNGNQWHFGMKAHSGVDVASGVVHTVTGTVTHEPTFGAMLLCHFENRAKSSKFSSCSHNEELRRRNRGVPARHRLTVSF